MIRCKFLKITKLANLKKVSELCFVLSLMMFFSTIQVQAQSESMKGFSASTKTQNKVSATIGGSWIKINNHPGGYDLRPGVQQAQMIKKHYIESGDAPFLQAPVRGFFTDLPAGTSLPAGIYDSTSYAALHYNYSTFNYDSLTTLLLTVWPKPVFSDTIYVDSTELLAINTSPSHPMYVRARATRSQRFHAGRNFSFFQTIQGADSVINTVVYTCGGTAKDIEGNPYHSVFIGHDCWTTSNMRATHYSKTGGPAESMIYKSADHPDTVANLETYGRLYTWYAAVGLPDSSELNPDTTHRGGFVTGICPIGWHIPEAENIANLYANSSYALMTTSGWIEPGGTNTTGFSALPAGLYNPVTGRFENLLGETHFYTVEIHDLKSVMVCSLVFGCDKVLIDEAKLKSYGLSVRCVKDQVYDADGNVIPD